MNKVYKEVVERNENGDSTFWTASPELIQQVTQGIEGCASRVLLIQEDPLVGKLNSMLRHGGGHPMYCEYIKAQVEQIQASNGYTPPVQMH